MNDFLKKCSGTLRIVGIYALVGCLWVYTSDTVLGWFVQDPNIMVKIAIFKGSFYIIFTSLLLYFLINRFNRSLAVSEQALKDQVKTLLESEAERKQATETLLRSKNMLKRTESITHIGSWEWEIATDTVTWSEELFRIHQLNPDDGAPSFEEQSKLYHPEDMAKLQRVVGIALSEGTPYELELRAIRQDGETRHCLARGLSDKNSEGRVLRIFGSLQDISEQKRAEEGLLKSERKYRQLFQHQPVGFALHEIILDTEGKPYDYRFLEINPAFENLTGLKASDLIGKTQLEVMPKSEPYWAETYGKVALTGTTISFDNYSGVFNKYYQVVAYSPESNKFATLFMDITDLKQTEADLLNIRRLHEETEKIGKVGGWEFDTETLEQTWTDEVYRIHEVDLSFKPTVADGISFYTAESRSAIEQVVQRAIEHGEPFDVELV